MIPIVIYAAVLSLMAYSALLTPLRPSWDLVPALITSAGAVLFLVSDTTLAWNRFVQPLNNGPLLVIITYHLGQLALIAGVALNFK
jgi:uncharacterized membrane protein YhhN